MRIKLFFIAVLCAAACLSTINCKVDTPKIDVNLPIAKAPVTIQYLNANPNGGAIAPAGITVRIVGTDAGSVVNFKKGKTFEVETGAFLKIGLEEAASPSESRPYEFTVITTGEGYLPTLQTVIIAGEEPQVIEVPMVKLSAPPTGVSVATGSFETQTTGAIAPFNLNTPTTGGKQERAMAHIPVGTILYDANGTALTGTVAVTLAHFDTRTEESLAAFPGGFIANNVQGTTDNAPVAFSTGGFASLEMTVGGTVVKTFNQPISIDIEIAPDVKNADNNDNPIAAGDQIPFWSMDKTTGVWRKEGSAAIVNNGGKLQATITTNHLSYFNLDYYFSTCRLSCGSVTFQNGVVPAGYYLVELYNAQTGVCFKRHYEYINNNTMRFLFAPNRVCILKVRGTGANSCYSYGTGSVSHIYATSAPFNVATSNITVPLTQPATLPPLATITINVTANCTNQFVNTPQINTQVWYRPTGSSCWKYLGYLRNGRIVVSNAQLIIGQSYTFWTYYGNFQYTITGNENNYVLQLGSYCN